MEWSQYMSIVISVSAVSDPIAIAVMSGVVVLLAVLGAAGAVLVVVGFGAGLGVGRVV